MNTRFDIPDSDSTRGAVRSRVVELATLLVIAAYVIGGGVALLFFILHLWSGDSANDLVSYWAAAKQLIHHASPYDAAAILRTEHAGGLPANIPALIVRNPPLILPLIWPLGYFSAPVAARLWLLFSTTCTAAAIYLFGRRHNVGRIAWLVFAFAPVAASLHTGQCAPLLALAIALFLRCERGHPAIAGAALSLCILKPHLFFPLWAVLMVWSIANRKYRLALGFAAALTVLSGVATLLAGPRIWGQYGTLLSGVAAGREFIPAPSVLLELALPSTFAWIRYLPAALAALWAVLHYIRARASWNWAQQLPLLLTLGVAVAPYFWFTDLAILLPLAIFALTSSRAALLVFAAINAAIQIPLEHGLSIHSSWIAAITLAWLIWIVAVQAVRQPASRELCESFQPDKALAE